MTLELSIGLGIDTFLGLIFYALKRHEENKLADISQAVEIHDGESVKGFLSDSPVIFSGSLQPSNSTTPNKYNAVFYQSFMTEIGDKFDEKTQKWHETSHPIKNNAIVCDAVIKRDIARTLNSPFTSAETIVLPKLEDIPGSDALFTTVLDEFIPMRPLEANGYRMKGIRLKETAIFNGTVVSVMGRLTSMGGIITLRAPFDSGNAFMICTRTKDELLNNIKSQVNIFKCLLGITVVVGGVIAVTIVVKHFNKSNNKDRGDSNRYIKNNC